MKISNLKKLSIASSLAVSLLVSLEGYGSTPYLDSAGVWTDCYGNTHSVSKNHIRTQEECKVLLNKEVDKLGKKIISDHPTIPRNTLIAVISWSYNVGIGAYNSSTLNKKLYKQDWLGACNELKRWNKITLNGVKITLPGLNNRRDKEYQVCISI